MGSHQPIRKLVTPEIPDKLYFRIGDVAKLCEVPAYVLRFWETEFPQFKPNKGGTGQRLYRKRDVEMALRIKDLLYDQGYTIPGARQVFKEEAKKREAVASPNQPQSIAPALSLTEFTPRPERITVETPASAPASSQETSQKLIAIHADLRSLLDLLANPVSATHPPASGKIKPMRPRLELAPKPEAAKPEPKLSKPTLLKLTQRDLFGGSTGDDGPVAS